jgi:predicted RNA binding protein YcfA (HicA-like mRNA interferase family)
MPRLNCTFADFIGILERHGFVLHRHDGGSHRLYRAVIDGTVKIVTVAPHRMNDPIKAGTLSAMIRQSGLPKGIFRD